MGYLKFSSVSLYEASFPRKKKIYIFFFFKKKSKILIFWTFYMYRLSEIFVRFALRGFVSEKKKKKNNFEKKSKIFIFFTFNMYGLSQIFVRFEKKVKFSFF